MAGTDIVAKCIALGLVLMFVGVQADGLVVIPNHPNCPDAEGPIPVYFVHPTNCSKFYECRKKDAYEFDCPAGLHFNSRLNVCDHPLAAQCESLGPETTTDWPATTPPPTVEPTTTWVPPATETTTPQPTTAPPTTTWVPPATTTVTTTQQPTTSPPTTTWVPPATTTVTTTPTPTSSSTTTTAPLTTTTRPPETTTLPTTANPTPSSALPPLTTTLRPVDPNCPPAGSSSPSYWPHATDCTQYVGCWEGCTQKFQCPDGRYYNDALKACDTTNWHCACPVIPPVQNVG